MINTFERKNTNAIETFCASKYLRNLLNKLSWKGESKKICEIKISRFLQYFYNINMSQYFYSSYVIF